VGLIASGFMSYYQITITKVILHWDKHRTIEQWHRLLPSEIHTHTQSQLIINEGAKSIMGNIIIFNEKCWDKWVDLLEYKNDLDS
jgi:hypothetical protein